MKRIAQIVMTLLLTVAAAATATDGPHFTFTVPIELNHLPPEVDTLKVSCWVGKWGATGGNLGGGNATQPVSGGSFHGDVRIAITLGPLQDPNLVDAYGCTMSLEGAIGSSRIVFMGPGAAAAYVRFPLAAGATYRSGFQVRMTH